jgi:hypothetical protein
MEARANEIYKIILQDIVRPKLGFTTTFGRTLNNYMKKIVGSKFHGVYPSDKIPKLTNNKPYAIINLDTSTGPGSHWVAIAKSGANIIVYDSFGRKSRKILSSVFKSGNGLVKDTDYDAEQSQSELSCGQRSCAWLVMVNSFGSKLALLI